MYNKDTLLRLEADPNGYGEKARQIIMAHVAGYIRVIRAC